MWTMMFAGCWWYTTKEHLLTTGVVQTLLSSTKTSAWVGMVVPKPYQVSLGNALRGASKLKDLPKGSFMTFCFSA